MKPKNFYLPRTNKDRLLEELEYETKNLSILKKMKITPIIDSEIKQTEYTLKRINDRLNPSAESGVLARKSEKKNRLLGVNRDVSNVIIREYIKPDETRYFTATILKWKNFKFYPSSKIKSTQLLVEFVIPKVREIRDELKGKTLDEQMKIVDELPTEFTYSPSAESGILIGKTDINGREGIPALMPDGKILKVGGGEIIMNEKASTDNCKELSRMNVKAGGVAFDCDLQKVANTDRASGKMPKDEWHKEKIIDRTPSLLRGGLIGKNKFYEIDDSVYVWKYTNMAQIYPFRNEEKQVCELYYLIDHPILFDKHPEIKNIKVYFKDMRGESQHAETELPLNFRNNLTKCKITLYLNFKYYKQYGKEFSTLESKTPEDSRQAILLHELQHILQASYNRPCGISRKEANRKADARMDALRNRKKIKILTEKEEQEFSILNTLTKDQLYDLFYYNDDGEIEARLIVRKWLLNKGINYIDPLEEFGFKAPSASSGTRTIDRNGLIYSDMTPEVAWTKWDKPQKYAFFVDAGFHSADFNDWASRNWEKVPHVLKNEFKYWLKQKQSKHFASGKKTIIISSETGDKINNMKNIFTTKEIAFPKGNKEWTIYKDGKQFEALLYYDKKEDAEATADILNRSVSQEDSASSGTNADGGIKTQTPINYYYLKIGNKINEWHDGKLSYKYEIVRFKKDGHGRVVAMFKEYSLTPGRPNVEFETALDAIQDFMDLKHYTIDGTIYETDRDKILLQNEIAGIIQAEEAKELVATAELAQEKAAKVQEETDHVRQSSADTIAGMEAMASGTRNGSASSGKSIPNNYEGKLAGDVWDAWNFNQRMHFFDDHLSELPPSVTREEFRKYANQKYIDLKLFLQKSILSHIERGQYSGGGQGKGMRFQKESSTIADDILENLKEYKHIPNATIIRVAKTHKIKPTPEIIEEVKEILEISGKSVSSAAKGAKVGGGENNKQYWDRQVGDIKEELDTHIKDYGKGAETVKTLKADLAHAKRMAKAKWRDSASSGTQIKKVTKKKNFYHVRLRVPRGVETCRVPDWGKTVADSVHDGAKITMCKFNGDFKLQKVMVPAKGVSKSEAEAIAKKIIDKIEKK